MKRGEERWIPNSNVTLEMGFAAGALGWERVICVMNEHYGRREDQPFDVRNRRFPINYKLAPKADNATRERVLAELVVDLRSALTGSEQCELLKVERAVELLDLNCLHMIFSYGGEPCFSEPDEPGKEHVRTLFEKSIPRLLDLRLVLSRQQFPLYAYHWTYLGKKVIKEINRASSLEAMLKAARERGGFVNVSPRS